jgi:Cu/Ag efflux protein CusF
MKKQAALITLTALFLASYAFSADQAAKQFNGSGEVVSSDPVYSRVTIKHKPIQGFVGGVETEFVVASPAILKEINRHDLVDFSFEDSKGNIQITKITKTGITAPKNDSLPIGQAVQDVLVGTGHVAKVVTSPIPAVNEVVSGAVGATTDSTEPVLEDAKPEIKKSF